MKAKPLTDPGAVDVIPSGPPAIARSVSGGSDARREDPLRT